MADCYRREDAAGMTDRSCRPHRSPARTPEHLVRAIVRLRWRHRLGPVQIAGRLGIPASTVHAVLVRCRINRLTHVDRGIGEPLRRCEHDHPGSLIHVDVTKLAKIPDGGGWRYVGKQQGDKNRSVTSRRTGTWSTDRHARTGTAFVHPDETAATAVLRRAAAWFADLGVTVERVLSDNGSAHRSRAWHDTCAELGITPKRTRPYRPQSNGKIERFHRTLAEG
ncbi:DDE-type integrase/transposase/recombinase [Amycolatopsis sp. SID8362]|nr:DDE-type integrase/transposase/recombinase [Amycolatopsis sp. SID8362]NED48187.1 transposase family protein [Amycolatopsis sp. SID8362]